MADNQQPTYQAYAVIKRDGQDDWWCNIGSAWLHGDGQGLNVLLHALPVNGKIVLRPPKTDGNEQPQEQKNNMRPMKHRRGS